MSPYRESSQPHDHSQPDRNNRIYFVPVKTEEEAQELERKFPKHFLRTSQVHYYF